jgi:hypothetical protein
MCKCTLWNCLTVSTSSTNASIASSRCRRTQSFVGPRSRCKRQQQPAGCQQCLTVFVFITLESLCTRSAYPLCCVISTGHTRLDPLNLRHFKPTGHLAHCPPVLFFILSSSVALWDCRKAYVNSDELMDFITDTVAGAPDLPPEGEPEQPKAKRQRCVCSNRAYNMIHACVCVCGGGCCAGVG